MATVKLHPETTGSSPKSLRPLHPVVSVVVVNYRQWDQTIQLVDQLNASHALRSNVAEVVVVDNHSPMHPLVKGFRRRPGVSVRRWERNHGFARAVNEGCRLSGGDWFLLLNPDTTPPEGFLDDLLKRIPEYEARDPQAGIIGFHLRNPDGSQQLSSGPFPTLLGTLARLLLPRSRRKYQHVRATEAQRVPWVTGCCLLVRRACWQDLRGLDENFFLYYEDVDLCRRAHERGWSVWYEPSLPIVHHNPLHNRAVPPALRLVIRHSLLTYARNHWPGSQTRILGRIIQIESVMRRLVAMWRGDHHNASIEAELCRLVSDCLAGEPALARTRLEDIVHKKDLRMGF